MPAHIAFISQVINTALYKDMTTHIEKLPTLGVGVSLSLSSQPDPVKLVQSQGGPDLVEYAGLVDVEMVIDEVDRVHEAGASVLYHSSHLNFCGSYPNSEAWLQATAKHIETVNSPWLAQDITYCFWENSTGYCSQLGYFIPPIMNEASLESAITRVKEIQAVIPVTIAIEPPPVVFVAGTMPLFSFFGEVARETDCAILLDMGHLVSYEMANGKPVRDALDDLPCERVVEVHVAGGRLKSAKGGTIYVDAHETDIPDPTWAMLDDLLPELPNVKAVCYECEGIGEEKVLSVLERLRKSLLMHSASKELVAGLEANS